MSNLYQLTDDFNKLMECDEDETTNALIEISANEITVKAESYCKFLANLESDIEQFKAEEKRISGARKAMENKVERAKQYMKEALLNANIDKLTAGTFKISVSMTAGSLAIDDNDAIPAKFKTVVQTVTVDKNAIKEAIKAGENVPGAHIEANTSLRIR